MRAVCMRAVMGLLRGGHLERAQRESAGARFAAAEEPHGEPSRRQRHQHQRYVHLRGSQSEGASSKQQSSKQQAASSKQQAASSKQAATNLGGPRWCNWQAGGKRRQKERAQSYALLLIVTPWSAPKYSHHRVLNCEARWETETANGASILTQALVARAMPSPKTLAARMGPSSATFARQARGQSMQNETKTNCDDKRMR